MKPSSSLSSSFSSSSSLSSLGSLCGSSSSSSSSSSSKAANGSSPASCLCDFLLQSNLAVFQETKVVIDEAAVRMKFSSKDRFFLIVIMFSLLN